MRRVAIAPHTSVDPRLAPTLAPLETPPQAAFRRLASLGFRRVQLSATQAGLRPRELDGSARRDLVVTLRRREIEVGGVDLWIPPSHFGEAARVDRAVAAVVEAIRLAADLGRCPVSLELPAGEEAEGVIASLRDTAMHHGVALADHAVPARVREGVGLGIDPVAWLADGADPVEGVVTAEDRLVSARLCDLVRGGLRGAVGEDGGRLDLAAYRAALTMRGEAAVVVDARQWADPWHGVRRTAEAWGT